MKKIVFAFLLCIPFISCVSKKSADTLTAKNDSLTAVVAQKDLIINDVFVAMNGIAENLNNITAREKVISASLDNGEIKNQTTAQINRDIEAIDRLLVQNRENIQRLQANVEQLRKANVKIDGLEKLVAQLNTQLEQKDQEIVIFRKNLQNLNIQVAELSIQVGDLNTQVTALSDEKSVLEGEIKTASDVLNTAYYIVGDEKELLKKEIIYKSGFIGRTVKINENRSLDSFTQVDVRDFDEVLVGQKKATLVSSHPAGSYIFETNSQGVFESIVIVDKDRFWEYSKVLVVSYK